MNTLFWLVVAAFAATLVGLVWYIRRKAEERRLAEKARVAAFVSGLGAAVSPPAPKPAPAPTQIPSLPTGDLTLQKLLFDAARKAGEAGEPVLAIQLYARLLSRFPATSFGEPARAAVALLNKKVVKS